MTRIQLSDAIENLRSELEKAGKAGEGKQVQFDIESIELELHIIADETSSGGGKINWCVFTGSLDAKSRKENLHKMKLVLKAVDAHGQPFRVASRGSRSK